MCFKVSLLQSTQVFVIQWDLFAIFQNDRIISISPLHLLSELLYKKIFLEKKGEKKPPHPSSEGPWFIFPVTNINFMAHFCLLEKKNVAYMNPSSILFIVLRPDLSMIKM